MDDTHLAGRRVLIVEDEMMIAMLLEDQLDELGCTVVATAARPARAIEEIAAHEFDLAILDINLGGEDSYGVADVLLERKIPFLFSTGYGDRGVKEGYRSQPVLRKPFVFAELVQKMTEALES